MCTAQMPQSVIFLNQQDPSSKTRNWLTSAVRSAMKRASQQQQQQQQEMPTPRAFSSRGDDLDRSSHGSARGAASNTMRRCQSANVSRRPGIPVMHKSRSHSGEPSQRQHQRTQELPIPPCEDGAPNPFANIDKNDLTKMYDYATWNMYERIVSARRQRLSEMAQQEKQSSSDSSSSQNGADNKAPTAATGSNVTKPQPLYKTSSQDESLAATADETDKSSTASSSWSRTDSPGFTGGSSSLTAFPNFQSRSSSCPLPGANNDHNQRGMNNEDHFIFELDM